MVPKMVPHGSGVVRQLLVALGQTSIKQNSLYCESDAILCHQHCTLYVLLGGVLTTFDTVRVYEFCLSTGIRVRVLRVRVFFLLPVRVRVRVFFPKKPNTSYGYARRPRLRLRLRFA